LNYMNLRERIARSSFLNDISDLLWHHCWVHE